MAVAKLPIQPTDGEREDKRFSAQLPGLGGASYYQQPNSHAEVLRALPLSAIPGINRQREYRLMRKLARGGLTTDDLQLTLQGLHTGWLPGQPLKPADFSPENGQLLGLISHLHHRPLTGYPLSVTSLLAEYWQRCQVRSAEWLRLLRHLTRQGEPAPLRLAPVHMDIHPGNLIESQGTLRLIDWEYAGDGDITLDIALICLQDPARERLWLSRYSEQMQLDYQQLLPQVSRWKPWMRLLVANWFQLRAEQSEDPQFAELARKHWQQLWHSRPASGGNGY